MQWHKEGFEPSPGAQRLASSPACVNQASALGPRSGMQFHVDAVEAKLGLRAGDDSCHQRRFQASHRSTVHAGPKVLAKMAACLAPPQAFACRLYARWLGATQAL